MAKKEETFSEWADRITKQSESVIKRMNEVIETNIKISADLDKIMRQRKYKK